jgi:hypothetical protein
MSSSINSLLSFSHLSPGRPVIAGALLTGLSTAVGAIMVAGALFSIVKVVGGALNYNKDPESSKSSFISAGIAAGAVIIVLAIFKAMGLDLSGITADFSNF